MHPLQHFMRKAVHDSAIKGHAVTGILSGNALEEGYKQKKRVKAYHVHTVLTSLRHNKNEACNQTGINISDMTVADKVAIIFIYR